MAHRMMRGRLFDCDVVVLGNLLNVFFRNADLQDTVLKFSLDILLGQVVADVESTAHRTGVTLAADILAVFLLLILVKALGSADAQVTVVQLYVDLILLKAWQVDIQLVAVVGLADIGLHHVAAVLAVQRTIHAVHFLIKIEHIIKQTLTKDARQ